MNPTFNLPDFTDNKVPLGVGSSANVGRYNAGEVPNITGEIYNTEASSPIRYGGIRTTGALFLSQETAGTMNLSGTGSYLIGRGLGVDASRSSSVYKNVSRVIAHGIMMFYCIRYYI